MGTTAISFKPSLFAHGGGLLDDVDVTIKDVKFVEWDYNGSIPEAVLAFGVTYVDDEGAETDQYYSAGNLKDFAPSKDGKTVVPTGTKTALNDGSNFFSFIKSLVENGFPEDKLDDDMSVITGTYCHVKRAAQQKRTGIAATNKSGREATVLLVEKVLSLPWEKKTAKPGGVAKKSTPTVAGKSAAAAGGKTNGAAAATTDQDLYTDTVGAVVDAVIQNNGSLPKTSISKVLFNQLAKHPNRNKIATLAFKDEFLSAPDQPWQYDGETITMG